MSSGQGSGSENENSVSGTQSNAQSTDGNASELQAKDQPAPAQPTENSSPDSARASSGTSDSSSESAAQRPTAASAASSGGPLSIERIRQLRASQNAATGAARAPQRPAERPSPNAPESKRPPASAAGTAGLRDLSDNVTAAHSSDRQTTEAQPTAADTGSAAQPGGDHGQQPSTGRSGDRSGDRGGDRTGDRGRRKPSGKQRDESRPVFEAPLPKLEVPSRRAALPSELQNELEQALVGTDLDRMLIGDAMVQVGREIEEGQRVQGRVLKVHGEHVFVSLGGPNEGVISILQFTEPPAVGTQLDVIVRGYLTEEGLYDLAMPGSAVTVDDWSDIKEGEVVEAKVTAANTGGLECTVGNIRAFIPASQVAEFRIEDFSEFIDQKVLCVVTQSNPARGNLVLSRRAVLERERAEKREQRLRELEVGATVEGTVRKLMDFGAFVDIGGLDGLLHISQLSWEKIKHPSEVLEEGQKIQVRVDKIDPQTGKIGLSYRSLQDHPWTNIEQRFAVGSIVHGTVSRIADFGAFVRLATGIEGLVHLSELAHHRVHKVSGVVQEGQEVDVKVLSVEPERQRMSLSLKAAQQPPAVDSAADEPQAEEAPRELALPKHRGPLKGGIGRSGGGEQFGLKW